MPSSTFNNLEKSKKLRIVRAATKEFSNYTLREASINRIIKDADISRGSFYLYFKNIDDIYNYVVNVYIEKMESVFITYLKNNNGDLYESFINLYDYIINTANTKANKDFCEKIFTNVSIHSIERNEKCRKDTYIKNVVQFINKEEISITKDSDIINLIELYLHIMMMSVVSVIVIKENVTEEKKRLLLNFSVLRKGMSK